MDLGLSLLPPLSIVTSTRIDPSIQGILMMVFGFLIVSMGLMVFKKFNALSLIAERRLMSFKQGLTERHVATMPRPCESSPH